MNRVALGPTGIGTTQLGFGCAQLCRLPRNRDRLALLEAAFEVGIRHFDVARMYGLGEAEGVLAQFLRGKRDQVTIATKFGIPLSSLAARLGRWQGLARAAIRLAPRLRKVAVKSAGPIYSPRDFSVATAERSLKESLHRLGVDHVDVFFLHDPQPSSEIPAELVSWLEGRRQAGVIREYGASGELGAMSRLFEAHPELRRVTQFASDPLTNRRSEFTPLSSEGVINFSCVANVLHRLQAAIDFQSLSESAKLETLSRVAAGCVSHSVAANSQGVTLVSSTDSVHLKQLVTAGNTSDANRSENFAEWMQRLGAEQLSEANT
jgi:hypothetical protein